MRIYGCGGEVGAEWHTAEMDYLSNVEDNRENLLNKDSLVET